MLIVSRHDSAWSGRQTKIPPDSRTARRLTYNTSRDRLFRRLRFNLERSASLRVAEQSRTSVLSPFTLNVNDSVVCTSVHEPCSCSLGLELCKAPCNNNITKMLDKYHLRDKYRRRDPAPDMATPSSPTLSQPTTPANKCFHFADASTSTLSPSNGGYPCASPSPTTYLSGGVENLHMQGIVCVSPCSDHSDGASRAPSIIAYSHSD